MSRKNLALAAVMNIFLVGAGKIYVGRRVSVGLVMTLSGTTALVAEILISPPVYNLAPSIWPFLLGGLVVPRIGLAVDAHHEAREVNGG